ncbi:peptide chain release factor N(5)-glutamine methyltransferase [Beijerinckia indica]|uniref:Release factor glutamine methyltransferase n=1 Tax=Beijerinckia indica subsp. indica (strain ATCC 9039 / DSM 1715 / NCIMB 8712) TaxID=395963 RepID=B2IH61_BEII9|nr:peptide chain release factor N(5)-glutamine methyltransferase [Beijerinckia indica]ACB94475.1 protein-(glutamine-N5) methyltransferase, release factor-specific [Beijerinckia indica subsp. indica ATCC 9039]
MTKQWGAPETALPPILSQGDFPAGLRRDEAQRHLTAFFSAAGLETPGLDARLLLCAALGIDHAGLIRDPAEPIGDKAKVLDAFCRRRLAREPVSRIIGEREFWSLDLKLDPAVLDPRPDTETLIDLVLREVGKRACPPQRVLDLGTGSGAILAALLTEWPEAFGVGVDLSPRTCAIAAGNFARLGLGDRAAVFCGRWSAALSGRFDLIVSNPPYIVLDEIDTLAPEVSLYDPRLALDGGPDGFDAYRALLPPLASLLAEGGLVALECGAGQSPILQDLLRAAQLEPMSIGLDLSGHERVVLAKSFS